MLPRISPNRWAGVRTPSTFADDRVWRDTNRLAGSDLRRFGILYVLVTLALALLGLGGAFWVASLVLTVGLVLLVARSVIYARKRLVYYRALEGIVEPPET